MNTDDWKVSDSRWKSKRNVEWLEEAMPLVLSMYSRGGDLTPKSAHAVKHYFFTGEYQEQPSFPLFYRLRFYPGIDQDWFLNCILTANDLEILRFLAMYKVDGMGPNDSLMANTWYSPEVNKRLLEIDKARDKDEFLGLAMMERDSFVSKKMDVHVFRLTKDDYVVPDHYIYKLGEKWLDIVQAFEQRNHYKDDLFIKCIRGIFETLKEGFLGNYDAINRNHYKALNAIKSHLDSSLTNEYQLRDEWESIKKKSGTS